MFYEIQNIKKTKETFDAASDAAITTAVKKIYLADVEAIRILSNFAIQLSQGGTTISGITTFSGEIQTPDDHYIRCAGTQNIYGTKKLVLLNKEGVQVSKASSGNGDLYAEGNIRTDNILLLSNNNALHGGTDYVRLGSHTNQSDYKQLAIKNLWCNNILLNGDNGWIKCNGIRIGNWYISDREDGLGFCYNGINTHGDELKYFMWNNGKNLWGKIGEHVIYGDKLGKSIDLGTGYIFNNGSMGMMNEQGRHFYMEDTGAMTVKDVWCSSGRSIATQDYAVARCR